MTNITVSKLAKLLSNTTIKLINNKTLCFSIPESRDMVINPFEIVNATGNNMKTNTRYSGSNGVHNMNTVNTYRYVDSKALASLLFIDCRLSYNHFSQALDNDTIINDVVLNVLLTLKETGCNYVDELPENIKEKLNLEY